MKMNTYEAPAFELLAFQAEDVIRTSPVARFCSDTPWDYSVAGGTPIDPNV